MRFADFERTVNASVLQHLANASVRIDGGDAQPGIFRNPSSIAAVGVGAADTSPSVTVASSVVPANAEDKTVDIDGVLYGIVRDAPDGTGLTVLTVEQLP